MWQAIRVTETFQDMAGKWYCRVLISDGISEETVFIKFQSEPGVEDAITNAQRLCDSRNQGVE